MISEEMEYLWDAMAKEDGVAPYEDDDGSDDTDEDC